MGAPEEQKRRTDQKSTGGVLVKDLPKVKLVMEESPRTQ